MGQSDPFEITRSTREVAPPATFTACSALAPDLALMDTVKASTLTLRDVGFAWFVGASFFLVPVRWRGRPTDSSAP